MTIERTGRRGEAGFSLVEVTLALLVVAVGMTAAFSLFPEGIQSTRAAVNNTETALFADYVFATLELVVGIDGDVLDTRLDKFMSPMFDQDADAKNYRIRETDSQKPNTFYWMPQYYGLSGLEEMNDSYFAGKLKTAAFTYTLTLDDVPQRGDPAAILAVLKVWPGEYGDDIQTSDLKEQDARVFYREIQPVK